MRHQIRPQRLQHQALRRRDLSQPRQIVTRQRPEVRVRQHPSLERPLAGPRHIPDEVLEPVARQQLPNPRVVPRIVARQHQQLLDPPPRRPIDQPLHHLRRMQMRLMRLKRAVLAMRHTRPRQRQRQVAREGDPASPNVPPVRTTQHPGDCARPRLRMQIALYSLPAITAKEHRWARPGLESASFSGAL